MVQAVEASKLLNREPNRARGCLGQNGIGGESERILAKLALSRFEAVWISANDNYPRTLRDKGARGREAEAGGAADDDERLCGEGTVLRVACCVLCQKYLIRFHVSQAQLSF
jgi:hypothetical protein